MQNYSCKNCGAELFWDTKAGCLKCQYCDMEYKPEEFDDKTISEEPVSEPEIVEQEYTNVDLTEDMVVYRCDTCGGEVVALKTTMATICPYCSEAISITSKSVGEFRPEQCIPFKYDKKQIMQIYKDYVNKSFLTPKEFKQDNIIEKIQGIFTPFYLHDIDLRAAHSFEGEKVTSSRSGYDKIDTHKVYELSIQSLGKFEKIPTDASVKIENSLMDAIEPFDYKECKDYNPAYMAGFVAEQTDEEMASMEERAKTRSTQSVREKNRAAFNSYSRVTQKSENLNFLSHDKKYVMLPVWLLNVKHGDKKYRFAINGQTGKIVGKLPINFGKLIGLSAGAFAVVDLIAALLFSFA